MFNANCETNQTDPSLWIVLWLLFLFTKNQKARKIECETNRHHCFMKEKKEHHSGGGGDCGVCNKIYWNVFQMVDVLQNLKSTPFSITHMLVKGAFVCVHLSFEWNPTTIIWNFSSKFSWSKVNSDSVISCHCMQENWNSCNFGELKTSAHWTLQWVQHSVYLKLLTLKIIYLNLLRARNSHHIIFNQNSAVAL